MALEQEFELEVAEDEEASVMAIINAGTLQQLVDFIDSKQR